MRRGRHGKASARASTAWFILFIFGIILIFVGFSWTSLGLPAYAIVVNPTISVTPNPASAGMLLSVGGSGYSLSGSVYVWMQQGTTGNPNVIANPIASDSGSWSISVGLAPTQPYGTYYLWGQDQKTMVQTGKLALTVGPITATSTSTSLPSTSTSQTSLTTSQSSTTSSQSQSTVTTVVTYTSSSVASTTTTFTTVLSNGCMTFTYTITGDPNQPISIPQTCLSATSTSSTSSTMNLVTSTITQTIKATSGGFVFGFPQLLSVSFGFILSSVSAFGFVRRISP